MIFRKKEKEISEDKSEEQDQRKQAIDALKAIGIDVPEDLDPSMTPVFSGSITIGPDGIKGVEVFTEIIYRFLAGSRMQGAAPEIVRNFSTALLGSFAMTMAIALAGDGEIDEENELAKYAAMQDQSLNTRIEIARDLCIKTYEELELFNTWFEKLQEKKSDEPKLVDPKEAAELAKLFQQKGEEGDGS